MFKKYRVVAELNDGEILISEPRYTHLSCVRMIILCFESDKVIERKATYYISEV